MILDSTNLLTAYGWRLASMEGNLDQPARKKILKVQSHQDKDLKYEGRKVRVTLHQKFTSEALLWIGVRDIHYLLENNATHTVEITEHGMTAFSAVAREGAQVRIDRMVATISITFTQTT